MARKGEDSLKVALFGCVLLALAPTAPLAAQPTPLLVGVIRDTAGSPVAGAHVDAFDATGHPDGGDTSERSGTFAIAVPRRAVRVVVSCRYCAPQTLAVPSAESEPLVVIVTRYSALAEQVPTQRDLQALPYRRPTDAVALAPFVVPSQMNGPYGAMVSDRGLDLGYAATLDEGMAAYDLSGQVTGLSIVPDRSVQHLNAQDASDAFRYGSAAGGGTFAFDSVGEAPAALSGDIGSNGTVAGYARAGILTPSAGESRDGDDGAVRRRAALDYQSAFAGGVLRASALDASQEPIGGSWSSAVDESLVHVAYATASRRYVTFVEGGASQFGLADSPLYGDAISQSTTVATSLRVEHPALITTAFGIVGQRYSGLYSMPYSPQLNAWVASDGGYVEASGGDAKTSVRAAAALWQTALETISSGFRRDGALSALIPSLSIRSAVAQHLTLNASASDSFRPATMGELFAAPGMTASGFERGALFDAGIQYDDDRRFRLEAMVFRERLTGFVQRSTTGVGASLAWQIAPRLSLRAWTLHDAAEQTNVTPSYLPYSPLSLSRGVAWLTYDNATGVRFDAIVHRDLAGALPETDIDADLVVPIVRRFAVTVGTERILGKRSVYAGLRIP